ncbi:hypothetical protein DFJ74DRAFT_707116 [Hyaloraphidium curvatum]|nr:hypothetical protein DFJ74DRAFT_707116 [Hyaloraphidium curvatum]
MAAPRRGGGTARGRLPRAAVHVMTLAAAVFVALAGAARAANLAIELEPLIDVNDKRLEIQGYLDNSQEFNENVQGCLKRGYSIERCLQTATFCLGASIVLEQMPWSFVPSEYFGAFKLDCGKGECFQCCQTGPGSCHTSFIGFPVINCDAKYGAGTKPAGLTRLDPDVDSLGQACLFIPQGCDHLSGCNSASVGVSRRRLAKRVQAAEIPGFQDEASDRSRALSFGMQVQWSFSKYLEDFATQTSQGTFENASSFETAEYSPHILTVQDWLTNRGRKGWRTDILTKPLFPSAADVPPHLQVRNESGHLQDQPSKLGLLVAWGVQNALRSFPNLYERFRYTEQRIWSTAAKQTSFAAALGTADPSAAAWNSSTGPSYAVMEGVWMLQDWRLLSIPAPGEPTVPAGQFQNVEMGKAARIVRIVLRRTRSPGSVEVRLVLEIEDPEAGVSANARPMAVDWGDHSPADPHQVPSSEATFAVAHTYTRAQAAKTFLVRIWLENETGLRSTVALAVRIAGTGVAPPPVRRALSSTQPLLVEIALPGFQLKNFDPNLVGMRFRLHLRRADQAAPGTLSGITPYLPSDGADDFNPQVRELLATNVNSEPALDRLAIEPDHAGIWCRYGNKFRFSRTLRGRTIDPATGRHVDFSIPLQRSDLKIFVSTELPDGAWSNATEAEPSLADSYITVNATAGTFDVELCVIPGLEWIVLSRLEVDLSSRAEELYAAAWSALSASLENGAAYDDLEAAGWAETRPGPGVRFADPAGEAARTARARWQGFGVAVWDEAWTTTQTTSTSATLTTSTTSQTSSTTTYTTSTTTYTTSTTTHTSSTTTFTSSTTTRTPDPVRTTSPPARTTTRQPDAVPITTAIARPTSKKVVPTTAGAKGGKRTTSRRRTTSKRRTSAKKRTSTKRKTSTRRRITTKKKTVKRM